MTSDRVLGAAINYPEVVNSAQSRSRLIREPIFVSK